MASVFKPHKGEKYDFMSGDFVFFILFSPGGGGGISILFLNLDIVVSLEPSRQRGWICTTPYLFSVEGSQLFSLPN